MHDLGPFLATDLEEMDERLLSRADAVVALREVYAGNRGNGVIQMRHDVDNHPDAFTTAKSFAQWEADRGYRSTYYLLHTARYWKWADFEYGVRYIASLGHEIGIHADALGDAIANGGNPNEILMRAIEELRGTGVPVRSVVGHGNQLCYRYEFANDEQFVECERRKQYGPPDRTIKGTSVKIDPMPLSYFGLDFEAVRLGRADQFTDSGGEWRGLKPEEVFEQFPLEKGQLHALIHPDHWGKAFRVTRV